VGQPSAPATDDGTPVDHQALASDDALLRRAHHVLAMNWTGSFAVPSRTQYPHHWSWDSALVSLGLPPQQAWQDLQSLLRAQWSDGRLPSIVFDPRAPANAYFPGPDVWQSRRAPGAPAVDTTGIVQPPLHAIAAWEIYRRAADAESARAALGALYPRLAAAHDYLARSRDLGGEGLMAIVHPWESGLDNSPAWDEPLAAIAVDRSITTRYQRRDRIHVPADHRPTDADYARYLTLVESYRDGGNGGAAPYGDAGLADRHPFLVECPLFNAVYAAADEALADIATVAGKDPGPHRDRAAAVREALVKHLFNAEAGAFFARDLRTGRLGTARTVAGLVPMLTDLPSHVVHALVTEATSPRFGLAEDAELAVPSYDRSGPAFDASRYWRGPIWFITNWLVWRGLLTQGQDDLADALRAVTLNLARRSGLYEYYDATTGSGRGAADVSFTAAITLDLLARSRLR
jgi:hypothetical protein